MQSATTCYELASRSQLTASHMRVQTEAAYEVKADLPGVPQDNITLEVDGDTISLGVKEERVSEEPVRKSEGGAAADAEAGEPATPTVHRRERSSSFVRRSVRMPEAADMENVSANYKDGVLTLEVPKREQAVSKRRQIAINSSA